MSAEAIEARRKAWREYGTRRRKDPAYREQMRAFQQTKEE